MTEIIGMVSEFHRKMGHSQAVGELSSFQLHQFLKLRVAMMREELLEIEDAIESVNEEDLLDGLVDLIYFAAGTIQIFGADGVEAMRLVHEANMAKLKGIKPGRPNPFGLPDAIKPDGWEPPSMEGLTGNLSRALGTRKPRSLSGDAVRIMRREGIPVIESKNRDYNEGILPQETYYLYKEKSLLNEIWKKIVRLVNLESSGKQAENEDVDQNAIDLGNYAFIYAAYVRRMREEKHAESD